MAQVFRQRVHTRPWVGRESASPSTAHWQSVQQSRSSLRKPRSRQRFTAFEGRPSCVAMARDDAEARAELVDENIAPRCTSDGPEVEQPWSQRGFITFLREYSVPIPPHEMAADDVERHCGSRWSRWERWGFETACHRHRAAPSPRHRVSPRRCPHSCKSAACRHPADNGEGGPACEGLGCDWGWSCVRPREISTRKQMHLTPQPGEMNGCINAALEKTAAHDGELLSLQG